MTTNGLTGVPTLGGNDKIYGGSNISGDQILAGGTFDDKVFSGSDITGSLFIYGDNDVDGGDMATNEDPDGRNMNDGNDLITVGNNNNMVKAYGQGGDDKIIGGFGENQSELLFGGSGDDKIWTISPAQRDLDNATTLMNSAYGGIGDDKLYGSAGVDRLVGDTTYRNPLTEGLQNTDTYGGDDWLRGFEGDDEI